MDRLEREAVESFRSVTSRGSEIGGLLIGSVAAGSPMVVSVADYQLIDCEYSRGPLYRLSDADLMNFQRAIEQRQAAGAGIAGFFRTHTRKGISLDPDDLAVLDAHFRDPHHIGLLVRPFATKASTGSIFIRENGKIAGDTSYLEFPFRSPGRRPSAGRSPKPRPRRWLLPPVAAKPAARAQIVPIASRREISMPPGGAEEKAPEAPAASTIVAAPPTALVNDKAKPQDKGKIDNKPAAKVEPKVAAKAEPKVEAKPAPKVEAKLEAKPAPKVSSPLRWKRALSPRWKPRSNRRSSPKPNPRSKPSRPPVWSKRKSRSR